MRGCERGAASLRDSLSHSRHGIHVTQAIGQHFHHMRRKMRRLLNEKVKPAPVDLRQARGGLRHSIGGARSCHRSTPSHQGARLGRQSRAQNHQGKCRLHLPIRRTSCSPFSPSRNRKSPGASCTVLLSCRNSSAGFMGQNQLLAAIERSATTAKLQLCDRRLRHSLKQILFLRVLRG